MESRGAGSSRSNMDDIYVSWCPRCGKENRQIGKEVVCVECGAEYRLTWPAGDGGIRAEAAS